MVLQVQWEDHFLSIIEKKKYHQAIKRKLLRWIADSGHARQQDLRGSYTGNSWSARVKSLKRRLFSCHHECNIIENKIFIATY